MAEVAYSTVEEVRDAPEIRSPARTDSQILQVIESTSREIEGLLHRKFYPELDTRTFDWPNDQLAATWRLWLDANEMASDSGVTVSVAGEVVPATDYFLRPDHGPPFTRLEIDLSSSSAFGGGPTHQRSISITGLFGYRADEASAGTVIEALDASETQVEISDASAIGIGSLIRVDSERMLVTSKSNLDTTQNIQVSLTAATNNVTVAVSDGTAFTTGEIILVDSERMLITDIAGNNLTVKRAWDGSVLAAHTSPADIYARRALTVQRGVLGTTAATHLINAPIYRHVVPGIIRSLCLGSTLFTLHQQHIDYAATTGGQLGQSTRETKGKALEDVWERAYGTIGRKARTRAA